jgi:hypothetical protein
MSMTLRLPCRHRRGQAHYRASFASLKQPMARTFFRGISKRSAHQAKMHRL